MWILGNGPLWIALCWYGASVSTNRLRELDQNWFHCWNQQCQRAYPKHNVWKCPQPVFNFLLIAQEAVTVYLMVLRDPGILQNHDIHGAGPLRVVTLSKVQGQRQGELLKTLTSSVRKASWRSSWAVDLTMKVSMLISPTATTRAVWSRTPRCLPGVPSHPNSSQYWDERQMPGKHNLPPPGYQVVLSWDWSYSYWPKFIGWTPLVVKLLMNGLNLTAWWHFFLLASMTTRLKWKCASIRLVVIMAYSHDHRECRRWWTSASVL